MTRYNRDTHIGLLTNKRIADLEVRVAQLEGMVEQIMAGVNEVRNHVLMLELEQPPTCEVDQ